MGDKRNIDRSELQVASAHPHPLLLFFYPCPTEKLKRPKGGIFSTLLYRWYTYKNKSVKNSRTYESILFSLT